MGELIDYIVILSIVEFINDPLKMGRVKCHIPGVLHSYDTNEEAMPWIRPFSMHAYQSFNMPVVGQKIWVLASKVNLNEYWWFPYFETTNITQNFLSAYYDDNPDVLHARDNTKSMITYTDREGYTIKTGGSYINVRGEDGIDIKSESCHMQIVENGIKLGKISGGFDKVANGKKLISYLDGLSTYFKALETASEPSQLKPLQELFGAIGEALSSIEDDKLCFN